MNSVSAIFYNWLLLENEFFFRIKKEMSREISAMNNRIFHCINSITYSYFRFCYIFIPTPESAGEFGCVLD